MTAPSLTRSLVKQGDCLVSDRGQARFPTAIIATNEQAEMSQMRGGHRQRAGSARRTGYEPCQGGGGAAERQEGRLAERQTEEKGTSVVGSDASAAAPRPLFTSPAREPNFAGQ